MDDGTGNYVEFFLLQTLSRESAAVRQRMISYLQFYLAMQVAMGGLFALLLATIPPAFASISNSIVAYQCAAGLLVSIGSFAYGAIWLFPQKRGEGWILKGLGACPKMGFVARGSVAEVDFMFV